MRVAVAIIASLIALASADAQKAVVTVGTGFVSPIDNAGLHLQGSVALSPHRRFFPRADFVLEQGSHRNLLLLGNLVYAPHGGYRGLYALAGIGAFLDNGPHALATGGIGLALPSVWRAPLAIEVRMMSHPDAHALITLLVQP
jgi:hypothetical protein